MLGHRKMVAERSERRTLVKRSRVIRLKTLTSNPPRFRPWRSTKRTSRTVQPFVTTAAMAAG